MSKRAREDQAQGSSKMSGDQSQGTLLLMKQLKELNKNPVEGFSAGLKDDQNAFVWEICIMGPQGTDYEGGIFNAEMKFPESYPNEPPTLQFTTEFFHPNVHENGNVCISILHAPGNDEYGYEDASERWLPIHTIESILLSVISMIHDPNVDSPANVDAAKMFRENKAEYRKRVARCVRRSQDA